MIIFIMIIALKVEGNIVQAYTKLQGEGTIDRPFLIQNEEDYVEFAKAVSEEKNHYTNQFVRITADLDFSKINMTVGVNDDHETYFSGVLDGMGHKISNVYLNQGDGPSGLFLNLNGLITNLQVENGIISGTSAGGIVGSVHDSGKVLNCCNKATVIGDTEDGIVGEFIGQVENCYGIDMNLMMRKLDLRIMKQRRTVKKIMMSSYRNM